MAAIGDDDSDAIVGINVTPLVDIVLVLLIIFMMTASYIVAKTIQVELPKAATGEADSTKTLSLVLTKEGLLYLNNREVEKDEVRAFIKREKQTTPELEALISADAALAHGEVVALIDLLKEEGVSKFALNTDANFSAKPPPPPLEDEGE